MLWGPYRSWGGYGGERAPRPYRFGSARGAQLVPIDPYRVGVPMGVPTGAIAAAGGGVPPPVTHHCSCLYRPPPRAGGDDSEQRSFLRVGGVGLGGIGDIGCVGQEV